MVLTRRKQLLRVTDDSVASDADGLMMVVNCGGDTLAKPGCMSAPDASHTVQSA